MRLLVDMSIAHDSSTKVSASLASFTGAVEGTSLYVIRAVEDTCDEIAGLTKILSGLVDGARALAKRVKELTPMKEVYLDPSDEIIDSLERSIDAIEDAIPKGILNAKEAIERDTSLGDGQRELLHLTLDENLQCLAHAVEEYKELRAAIIRHDLAAEPREGKEYGDIKEVMAALSAT